MSKMLLLDPNKFNTFSRLIPARGIYIAPKLLYKDVNDVDISERSACKTICGQDPGYRVLMNMGQYIAKGNIYDRRFCVYIYNDKDLIGNIVFTEILDNPHGYTKRDFFYVKWILPEYQHTKYSRYAIGDMIHILFKSNIANRLYVYMPARDVKSDFFFDQIKEDCPCCSKRYPSDNANVQKYIISKGITATFPVKYVLIEFNGDIYRNMDLEEYLMAGGHRKIEAVRAWLKEMDFAVEEVKRV